MRAIRKILDRRDRKLLRQRAPPEPAEPNVHGARPPMARSWGCPRCMASSSNPAATSGCPASLVEDDEPVRKVAARILQRYGYQVLEGGHGADALQL